MTQVPSELVDKIIDNLEGDAPSLLSCCRAARTFVQPSQMRLFKKVTILATSDGDPCYKFYNSITNSPHLASFVQELSVDMLQPGARAVHMGGRSYCSSWIMEHDTKLSKILPRLRLKHISLYDNTPAYQQTFPMDWTRLGPALLYALTAVFSSPTLESVHLKGWQLSSPQQLLSLFAKAKALKSLSISRLSFDRSGQWSTSAPWLPKLASLSILELEGKQTSSSFLHPQIDLSGITTLVVASGSQRRIMEPDVVKGLEHLSVYLGGSLDPKSFLTPNLRSIHLYVHNLDTVMLALFQSIPENSRLERITLDVYASHAAVDVKSRVFDNTMESRISSHLHSLRIVEIRCVLMHGEERGFFAWTERMRMAFQCLQRRGLLSFKRLSDSEYLEMWK
ncbi:hypothetical protein FB45DRAFT_941519 [Roridomyces roridus]|uniref:F-box domain-containing protein n=1 Tax=Roridomyces roridus TaxID=1738132 RepID=A0AAD7F9Z2_9AGAR|nr:hypothetical protein FB45DRAFT_941519 [Roridomyces roridus]